MQLYYIKQFAICEQREFNVVSEILEMETLFMKIGYIKNVQLSYYLDCSLCQHIVMEATDNVFIYPVGITLEILWKNSSFRKMRALQEVGPHTADGKRYYLSSIFWYEHLILQHMYNFALEYTLEWSSIVARQPWIGCKTCFHTLCKPPCKKQVS